MIVQRSYVNSKIGCMDELVKACQGVLPWWDEKKVTVRIYKPWLGPANVVCFEFEYDSVADWDKITDEWNASPECEQLFKNWGAIAERGGSAELWELAKRD